jgi:hypothetical protein
MTERSITKASNVAGGLTSVQYIHADLSSRLYERVPAKMEIGKGFRNRFYFFEQVSQLTYSRFHVLVK